MIQNKRIASFQRKMLAFINLITLLNFCEGFFPYLHWKDQDFEDVSILLTDARVPRISVWNEASVMEPENVLLLGELKERPQLAGETEEDIREFMDAVEAQKQVAMQVPREDFNIEFRMFKKQMGDSEYHILIEKKYEHIGGGASGKTKAVNRFHKVYKEIYRYYGVSEEDIAGKSKRYEDYLRQLARVR